MTWSIDSAGTCWRRGDYSLCCQHIAAARFTEATRAWTLMHTTGRICSVVSDCRTGAGPEGVRMARDWADGLIAERAL